MSPVLRNLAQSRQARWFSASLTVMAIALAACGGGDGNEGGAAGTAARRSEAAAGGEPALILIKTRVNLPTIKILDGSIIGDSPFCPGGTAKDKHGTPEIGLVDRTITCSDGTLRIGFDPQKPVGDTQSGPWRIISGTGAYERWEGSGEMKTMYDPSDNRKHPTRGRERFAGDSHAVDEKGGAPSVERRAAPAPRCCPRSRTPGSRGHRRALLRYRTALAAGPTYLMSRILAGQFRY
jgi:hypothetical protein